MKDKILYIIIGILITVGFGLGYDLYRLNKVVIQDHTTLLQVTDFLNAQIKASQEASK